MTDEQARLISMSMGQPCGHFPGPWPTQSTIGSPSTFSPASPAMFHDSNDDQMDEDTRAWYDARRQDIL
jgi:hypothetical protein